MAMKTVSFGYTGGVKTFTVPVTGKYFLEAWGANGGNSSRSTTRYGGKGGYASGFVDLVANQIIYIHIGGQGGDPKSLDSVSDAGGYNGGARLLSGESAYGAPGGGATDFRLQAGVWSDTVSLQSRILVAGGGGGANTRDDGYGCGSGGDGGGLVGTDGSTSGQTAGGLAYGYGYGTGGTQTSGGTYRWYQNGVFQSAGVSGSLGAGGGGQSGGGGGLYGGGGSGHGGAGGGSSYVGGVSTGITIAGVNSGNGKVAITYDDDKTIFLLKKDDLYYMPNKNNFDLVTKKFKPVSLLDMEAELEVNGGISPLLINSPFTIDSITYTPSNLINFAECKLCAITQKKLYKVNLTYTPSNAALLKTNIRVKDKYTQVSKGISPLFLDITSPDKNKIDYFIDYNRSDQDNFRKLCGILNTEVLKCDFYLSLKFDAIDSLLQTVTIFGRNNDLYTKIKDYSVDVYNDFIDAIYLKFNKDYDEVLVDRIIKQELIYTIDTLDKF